MVRLGGLIVRERRHPLPEPPRVARGGSAAWPAAQFPDMEPIDPDAVADLRELWARVQQDEPRSVLAPWFVHACHGRIATVHTADLRGNLVVRYQWAVDQAPVYSIFGTKDLQTAAAEALAAIAERGDQPALHQVSEQQAAVLRDVPGLRLERERDRDEYVLDTARHAALDGHAYKRMRYAIRHFTEKHHGAIEIRMLDAADPEQVAVIRQALHAMQSSSQRTGNDPDAWEAACLAEFARRPIGEPVRVFAIEIAGIVRGIGVFEVAIGHDAAVFHILRTEARFDDLVEFGVWALAQACAWQGITELNLEEDLGLPGLRRKKEHLHPARMIRHYRLTALP